MTPALPTNTDSARPAANPFCTRRTRPGAQPFLFPPGLDAEQLVRRLAGLGWRAAILGPHGSGKSTLVRALIPALQQAGRRVELLTLTAGQRRLPQLALRRRAWQRRTLAVVDGYQQLSLPQRWRLRWACRCAGCGLLVTAHAPVRLAPLLRLQPTAELARRVAASLLPPHPQLIGPEDCDRCYARQGGNLREMLFDLYDLWEQRCRAE